MTIHGKTPTSKSFGLLFKGLRKEIPSITPLNHSGNVLVDPTAKADALNFKSTFTTEYYSCLPNKGQSPHPTIADLIIPTFGIHHLLSSLNIHKSAGPNKINTIVLKEAREVTALNLCGFICYFSLFLAYSKRLEASKCSSCIQKREPPTSLRLQKNFSHQHCIRKKSSAPTE